MAEGTGLLADAPLVLASVSHPLRPSRDGEARTAEGCGAPLEVPLWA